MQIRVTGTKEECKLAESYYTEISKDKELVKSCSISILYPNRNSTNVYRLYINLEYVNAELTSTKKLEYR